MAQVQPFRAFRYNPACAPFDCVLTQPYDKISPAMQEKYYAADAHNLIIVEAGPFLPGRFAARQRLHSRRRRSRSLDPRQRRVARSRAVVLRLHPGIHRARERRAAHPGMASSARASSRIIPPGVIFRHEQTLSGPKADRLQLLRQRAHIQASSSCSTPTPNAAWTTSLLKPNPPRHLPRRCANEYGVGAPPLGGSRTRGGWPAIPRKAIRARAKTGYCRRSSSLRDGAELPHMSAARNPARAILNAPYEFAQMTFVNTRSEGSPSSPRIAWPPTLHRFSWANVRRYLEPWFSAETFSLVTTRKSPLRATRFLKRLVETHRARRAIGVYPAVANRQARLLRSGAALRRRSHATFAQRLAAAA